MTLLIVHLVVEFMWVCSCIVIDTVVMLLIGVCLKLLGRAKVHWTVSRRSNKRTRTTHYRAEEIYINEQVYLFGSRTSNFFIVISMSHSFPRNAVFS